MLMKNQNNGGVRTSFDPSTDGGFNNNPESASKSPFKYDLKMGSNNVNPMPVIITDESHADFSYIENSNSPLNDDPKA